MGAPAVHRKNPGVMTPTIVGFTFYDLQSNSSTSRRIIAFGDGTISFDWTIADAGTPYTNRGSGWNYWTGSALLLPPVTTRLETIRTGFSQIGYLANGSEVIMGHKGAPYDFQMGTNTTKGSATWTWASAGATLTASDVQGYTTGASNQALWGRIATGGWDGNSIHLVANYFPTDACVMKGIIAPMIYSRSSDAGQSWDYQSVMLPGYDSVRTLGGDAESYSIDAEWNTVAIAHGGLGEDVTLWKSTDNGDNWTRTLVDSFPYAPSIDSVGGPTDTANSNDGSLSVVVGPTGTVHIAYATERVLNDAVIGDGNYSIFPGDVGLVYWNDVAKTQVNVPILLADIDGAANGGNGDGIYNVGAATMTYQPQPAARYGNNALLNKPSISVDGNNVFILFSLPTDADSTADGQNFRDVWIVASQDGGVTWGSAQNITCTVGEEESFPCLAKRVDSYLYVLYQWDTEPGTALTNLDPDGSNEIHFIAINKANVLAGSASCNPNAINTQTTPMFSVAPNFPNPTNGMTYFEITMRQNANVTLEIYNSIGEQVYASESKLSIGKQSLSVNASSLSSGLYFYTIKCGDASVKGKMTVVK